MKYEVTERAEILLKEEVKIVRISVRDLVEFVLREGDIDNRKIGMSDKDVMAMGGRLHRKIQRQMGSDYHAETAMKHSFDEEEMRHFEGCLPVEVIAKRGEQTLLFGPLRPVGFQSANNGETHYAVVQLRQDNKEGTLFNIVGFQTNLK